MAELRTIQQSEIRDFVGIRYLLALSDQYAVIPNPLQALGFSRQESQHQILVLGPSGMHLLSYHLVYQQDPNLHFMTLADQLARSASLLYDFLSRFMGHVPAFQLYIVVQDGNIEGEATTFVSFVPWSKVRQRIESAPLQLSEEQISTLLNVLKAEVSFQRVDRFHILCELERSTNNDLITYLAMNTVDDRPVVLKEIRLPYDPDQMERNAVIRGAKLAQSLEHENIVQVEKLIPKEDRCYVVSEWCEGGITLKQYMLEHPGLIPLTTAIQLIKDLCQALMYAHDQGLIHRNLTPENMLVTNEHRLKVFNFDVAKKADMHTLQSTDFKKLTQENPYAAPEYMIGTHQVDQRVDVYSIGVIFYELLTGRRPGHYDESLWEPPSRVIPGLPHYMDQLVARAIRFDKDQRFSTVHAFYSALEKGVSDKIGSRYQLLPDTLFKSVSKSSLVYKAIDEQSQTPVALKKLLVPPTTDYRSRLRNLRKTLEPLQALKHLHHPGLVSLIDTLIQDDDGYIVMNWVEGRNLRETLQKRPEQQGLLPEEVRQIALQLTTVLAYIHQQGYVHGDIKPENVMLADGWRVTLLDFVPWSKAETGKLLKIPKTVRYMAPELIHGQQTPDEQTDIFALGVLMYELLCHRFPYDIAQLKHEADRLHCHPEPLPDDIPPLLADVIFKALKIDRHERYQRFEQMQGDLELDPDVQTLSLRLNNQQPQDLLRISRTVWGLAFTGLFLTLLYIVQIGWSFLPVALPVVKESYYD